MVRTIHLHFNNTLNELIKEVKAAKCSNCNRFIKLWCDKGFCRFNLFITKKNDGCYGYPIFNNKIDINGKNEEVTMDFTLYASSIRNYSDKAILVAFGYTNKKNELKESSPVFIPKSMVKRICLTTGKVTVKGWWYAKNGYTWRYRTDRTHAPPPPIEKDDLATFNTSWGNYTTLEGIEVNY